MVEDGVWEGRWVGGGWWWKTVLLIGVVKNGAVDWGGKECCVKKEMDRGW